MVSVGGLDYGDKLPPVGSVTSSTALAIRNSTIIAHRLSIYLPQLLLPSRDPQKVQVKLNLLLNLSLLKFIFKMCIL